MGNTLKPGEALKVEESLVSTNKQYRLLLQSDSNFVLYREGGPKADPIWATGTNGKNITRAVMQADGDLALCDKDNKVVWHTGTQAPVNKASLVLEDSGRLHVSIWSSTQ